MGASLSAKIIHPPPAEQTSKKLREFDGLSGGFSRVVPLPKTAASSSDLSHSSSSDERLAPAYWILLLTLVLVPLGMAPGLHFFDITPKLLALVGGACLVWLALIAANCFPVPPPDRKVYFQLLAALTLVGVLATLFSTDTVLSLAGSEGRRLGLPAWLATLALAGAIPAVVGKNARRRRHLLAAMSLTGLATALYGFAQYLGIDPWINPVLYHIGEGAEQVVRPPATFGHANYFAIFLLLAWFEAIGLALSASTKSARWVWAISAGTIGLALVISGSRAGWLGAVAGMAILSLRAARRRSVITGALATAVLALLFVVSPWGQPLRNRARSFQDDPGVTGRALVWRDSLRLIGSHPLLGMGLDTYELNFLQAESVELAQLAPDQYAESPHNLFLDSFAATGIPGGLLFVALVAMALLAYARTSRAEPLEAGLFAALVAGLVAAQFSGETMTTRLALLTLVAFSVSTPVALARPAIRSAAGAFASASLLVTLVFGSQLVLADRALFQAAQAASRSDIEMVLEHGRRARAAFPWTGTHAFAFSRIAGQLLSGSNLLLGQRMELLAAAEESARSGLLHSSQPQTVLVHLASLEVLQGKQQEAQASLTSAMEAAPSWYRPRWLLAVLLASKGQLRQAAEQASAALDLGARIHPEIADSCLRILDLARAANLPEPGGFELPQPVAGNRFDRCGGRIVLPHELPFESTSGALLSPGAEGAWDGVAVSAPRVLHRNGELLLWYSGFDGRSWRAGLAQSRDGAAWQKRPQPRFEASALNESAGGEAVRGAFLWEQDRFHYWYAAGELPRIGWASSPDGQTWIRHPAPVLEPGAAGSWDSRGVSDPHVLRCGQTLLLFYIGLDSLAAPRLGVASSHDGIHWAKYSGNPVLPLGAPGSFDERGLREPMVLPISRGFALLYTGHDARDTRRIGLALSPDGIRWQKTGVVLDVSRTPWESRGVGSPTALVLGNQLRLWYGGVGPAAESAQQIGLATARVEEGVHLFYEHATVHPPDARPDTPNGRWAFPYQENSVVTLPESALTFAVDVPAGARFRATARMPLPGADPARAVVRINGEQLFSELATRATDINLDLSRFAGQRVELQLAATPTPQGQRAAWVQWLAPRITSEANR